MQYKLTLILSALIAAFSFTACGDDESSSDFGTQASTKDSKQANSSSLKNAKHSYSCQVQKDPFKIIEDIDGTIVETTVLLDGDSMATRIEIQFASQELADSECEFQKSEPIHQNTEIECRDKTIIITEYENGNEDKLKEAEEIFTATCETNDRDGVIFED